MGQYQYLERLALGRSAFQSGPATNDHTYSETNGSQTAGSSPDATECITNYTQEYDEKGRPENPAAEAQNARLRHASNEILALVGVVERKDSADARMHEIATLKRAVREQLLIREDNRGNEWSAVVDVVSWFALWWPTALVRRIQIGLYSTRLPFMEILRYETSIISGSGWRGLLLGLLPGTGIAILHKVLWQIFALIAEESIGALQNQIVLSKMQRRKARYLIRSLALFADVCLIAIDLLLLPLETYALALQLNIAPPTPWRPLLTTQLPYFFRAAYSKSFSNPASFLKSAAPYLIGYSFLTRDPSPEAPAFNDLTSYRLPVISEHEYARSYSYLPPSVLSDPFGAIMHHTWMLRQRFMRFVGWNLHEKEQPGAQHGWETDVRYETPDDEFGARVVSHRSTALARLPASWLGMRVDMFIIRLLLLPVEGMVMQKVAHFYIFTGMQLTTAAANMNLGQVVPSMIGLLTGRSTSIRRDAAINRISQLGLSMTLTLGIEAVFFGLVYAIVRRQGVTVFGWGKHDGEAEEDDDEDELLEVKDATI